MAMPDREKVITGLECCLKESDHLYSNPCNGCPYEGQECIERIEADALALLKEQEAVVRCKDCKYRFVDGDNVRFNMCLLNHNKVQPDDWFCADGERK